MVEVRNLVLPGLIIFPSRRTISTGKGPPQGGPFQFPAGAQSR